MKLYATVKNTRKGKKGTGDDTRIIIELSYKNIVLGEIALYAIKDGGEDLGYRILWNNKIIEEKEAKRQKA